MRLPTRSDAVYNGLWLPLQQSLSADDLELLFWLDLVQRDPRETDGHLRGATGTVGPAA